MNTKVWTYVIEKDLSTQELAELLSEGKTFVSQWTAHELQLEAGFEILQGKIIVVKVDEDVNSASGCSIDKLTRFMKEVSKKFGFDPMNRLLVAVKREGAIEVVHASKIKALLQQGSVSENTTIYNTAIANESEYLQWEQPLKNTWLKKFL